MQLEDLCLLSAFVPTFPTNPTTGLPMGTMQSQGLGSVLCNFPQDPNNPNPNLPAAKLVTIMNNSSDVIFPILYGSNSTADNTAGQVVRVEASGGTGYTGTFDVTFSHGSNDPNNLNPATAVVAGNNNIYAVQSFTAGSGYQPGDQVTVQSITPIGNSVVGTGATIQAFTSQVTQNGVKALYDPHDPMNDTYRGYIGEYINGQYELGLQPGHQVTVQVPIAFWDGGRQFMVDNGPVPLTSQFDPGYPLQANAEWSYNPSATPNALAGLGAGLSYIVYPTASNPMPLYGADLKDPNTGYANPNGVVMWYHEVTAGKPHVFPDNLPAVITETTFRDPLQTVIAPDMPPSQTMLIDNYDVSYVDTLGLPASMEATLVPSTPATPGSGQYAWTGADQSTTDMQQSVANFTTNNTSVNTDPNGVNGLGTYFNGLGWDQFYLPPGNNTTAADSIKQINNTPADTPVTIITQNSTAGLQNGSAVKIAGVTGQTNINGTWVISNLTSTSFALVGSSSDPSQNPSGGGTWTAVQITGVDVKKLAAASDATALSPNVNSTSPFDSTKFNLVSGGTVYSIDTTSTGVATMGHTTITGVLAAQALQMVVGMLWSPANNLAGQQLFPTGTTIASIASDGSGMGTYAITMSAPATATGSPGQAGVGGSFAFVGSLYTSATTPTGQPTTTPASIPMNSNIMTIDPNIGMYLRPGMMVTGSQIPAGTYIAATPGSISADFTTITLTKSIGGTASSGPYTFVGAPDSYVLQTLINNWYAWADYYVTQLASGPNAAPSGTFQATTTTYTNIYTIGSTDLNALTLTNIPSSFDMNQLRVGDVVTAATAGTLNANTTGSPAGTPNTPGYDPSLNYTIVSFDPVKRTVELSLPVAVKNATTDTFTFAPPQYVVRSSDAPAANPTSITGIDTSAGQMYTISSGNVSGLVSGQTQVTISGVIDQTTKLPAAINGQYIVVNVNTTNNTFQLQGTSATGTETFMGGTGVWSTGAGTIQYSLNFNVPSTAITGISNPSGKAITITTGSTVGLTPGEQITINGVTGGSQNINGTWTVTNITATTFDLAGLTGAVGGQGGPTGNGDMTLTGGTWTPANNLQFAQTVYDVMQTFSLLKDPTKLASRSALLLSYIMGGNTGTFVQNNDPSRQTTLPDFRTSNQLRNELKSLLRGVYDFNAVPDQSQWYPNPATPTPNATLNGSPITFGIYNLDPYVWFVHRVLNNSSYGFSFDDDVANAQAASSSLEIAVGGNAYTASPPPAAPFNGPNVLANPEGFSPFAQWGTQQSQGYIDTTTQTAKNNLAAGLTTIAGLDQSAVARLTASNPQKDAPGAFITSDIGLPAGVTVTVVNITALPQVSATITGIKNSTITPGAITISTANTVNLAPGVVSPTGSS